MNFFAPTSGSSPFIVSGGTIVMINLTNKFIVGLGSSDAVGTEIVKSDFLVVSASANAAVLRIGAITGVGTFISSEVSGSAISVPLDILVAGNNVTRFSVSGNVGIGNISPAVKLHTTIAADGYVAYFERSTGAIVAMYASTVTGKVGTSNNYPLSLVANGTTALTIDTSQNVIINNTATSAGAKLRVSGSVLIDGSASTFTFNGANGTLSMSPTYIGIANTSGLVAQLQMTSTNGTSSFNILCGNTQDAIGYSVYWGLYAGLANAPPGGTPNMWLLLSGNTQFGLLTDQGYKVYVSGTARVSSTMQVDGAVTLSNTLSVIKDVHIGQASLQPCAGLQVDGQIDSIWKGFLLPVMTNSQVLNISSPVDGLMAYDTTNHRLYIYTGGTWKYVSGLT